MKKNSKLYFVLIMFFTLILVSTLTSCATNNIHQSSVTTGDIPLVSERLIGTWINSESKYPLKIIIKSDGRQEFYISILDPVPFYWFDYEINDEWKTKEGIEWLEFTYYGVSSFNERRKVVGYAIASLSGDDSKMFLGWKTDSRPKKDENIENSMLYYREGTELAKFIVDLPSESYSVLIDRSEFSYLILYGLPDNESALEELKADIKDDDHIYIQSWAEFVSQSADTINSFVIHDDYECPWLVPGIIALLRTYPLTEIGLTWNSGIAITRMDYILTEEYYEKFQSDPEKYNREKTPYDFAHNPMEHFGGLLGW